MTYREMIEPIARLRGKSPRIVEVPVLSPRLSSYWLHLVTPVQASVARPLIEGLRNPTVAGDASLADLVPFGLTPFDEAARAASPAENQRGARPRRRASTACCCPSSISTGRRTRSARSSSSPGRSPAASASVNSTSGFLGPP